MNKPSSCRCKFPKKRYPTASQHAPDCPVAKMQAPQEPHHVPQPARPRRKSRRFGILVLLIAAALFAFECISFSSSYEGLYGVLGVASWSFLLAFAFVAVDFAGIGTMFAGVSEESSPMIFGAWLVSAFGDTALTYLVVSDSARQRADHIMVTAGAVSVETFTIYIPIMVALLIWLIQVVLVASMNKIADDHIKRAKQETW